MNNDVANSASNYLGTIGEHGFTAMLSEPDTRSGLTGIIGAPRINPTGSGLRIEDSRGATIDTLGAPLDDIARAGSWGREEIYWNASADELEDCAAMCRSGPPDGTTGFGPATRAHWRSADITRIIEALSVSLGQVKDGDLIAA